MYTTQRRCLTSTPTLSCARSGDAVTRALLRRWQGLRASPPYSATAPALALVTETLRHLEATAPTTTQQQQQPTEPKPSSAATLFHSPQDAQRIWRVVQRQRVPWREALQLLPWQLQAMSASQRAFVLKRVSATPWEVAQVVLAAADVVDDVRLVQHYRVMKGATHMVEFARLVSAALRERPELPDGLLPVPYGVLLHAYTLGRRSAQEAALVLQVSKHVTLLGRSALSRSAEERLVLGHAAVEGRVGQWGAALKTVERSRAVRLSARKGFQRFVQSIQDGSAGGVGVGRGDASARYEDGSSSIGSVSSRGHTPSATHSSNAVAVAMTGEVRAAGSSAWVSALATFLAQPPERQTYTEARTALAALPMRRSQQPDYVVLATEVLRHAAHRMYAGTLTRRLVSSTKRAEWAFALSLASAARCYDLAVPLIPLVPHNTQLPAELQDFRRAVANIAREKTKRPLLERAAAETLSYPQALAYALEGDAATRQTLLSYCPQSQPLSPLRSLLLVTSTSSSPDAGDASSDVDCCTFQSSALSQLVCGAANEKRQRYFFKVLPASMRSHHFRVSPATNAPLDVTGAAALPRTSAHHDGSAEGVKACRERLQRWRGQTATTPAACAAVLTDLSSFLRATHTIEGAPVPPKNNTKPTLTEEVFLRWVATLMSWGTVQLPPTERAHWPLVVLRAACLLRVTLDASLVSTAARSIPSMFVDQAALALPSILTAHTLLGNWQAGLQVCARLTRKEKDGTLRLDAQAGDSHKPHTVKYAPPPPTLPDAMAQVGYGAPTREALRHWSALEASSTAHSGSFPLLLTELKEHRDTRQLCEELHNTTGASSSRHGSARLEQLSRRRMLLGAAFTLLDEAALLERVVRAGGQRRVRAEDLDGHGLQRLLGVLPAAAASRVLTVEAAEGRCAQEHWLLLCASQPELPPSAVHSLVGLRPTSSALSALACARGAMAQQTPARCLKAVLRLAEKALDSPARPVLLLCIARLLRAFLSNDDALRLCVLQQAAPLEPHSELSGLDGVEAATTLQQAQRLLNRLQEVEELSVALKQARRIVRPFIDPSHDAARPAPASTATWVVVSSLHAAVSHALHLPIPASFTSHLFVSAVAADASDWHAALFFFNALRHPTTEERVALVCSLRFCGAAATSILLSHRRFMRRLPEQLMLWADEAGGPSKWQRSLALLTQASEGEERELKEGVQVAGTTAKDSAVNAEEERMGGAPSSTPLSPDVQAAMAKWNADECFRAAQLLRRQGFVHLSAQHARSLDHARVLEHDPAARRQVEAILVLLRKGTANAAAPPAPRSIEGTSPAPRREREGGRGVGRGRGLSRWDGH